MAIARFRPQAVRDIDAILDYIAAKNLDAALRFYTAVRKDGDRLAAMPGIGRVYGFRNPTHADIRFWPVKRFRNYLIFYRAVNDGIDILRLLHGARDLETEIGIQ